VRTYLWPSFYLTTAALQPLTGGAPGLRTSVLFCRILKAHLILSSVFLLPSCLPCFSGLLFSCDIFLSLSFYILIFLQPAWLGLPLPTSGA